MSTSESAHERLFRNKTVNSSARECDEKHFDSLDIHLSADYNHETDLFVYKSDIVRHLKEAEIVRQIDLKQAMIEKRFRYIDHPLVLGEII